MDLSAPEVLLTLAAVLLGAVVQGSIGFGMNLVAVPVVALVEPAALPATLVLVALPLSVAMVRNEHHAIDRRGVVWITLGRIPGTVLGVWIVTATSTGTLSAIIGVAVLSAVAMSVTGNPLSVTRATSTVAGFASGAMGTAAAIGGPPLALLYQHHEGPVIRSTLATSFLVGTSLSIAGLALVAEVHLRHFVLAAVLVPGALTGLWISRRITHALDAGWLRPAVLAFAAAAGAIAIVNGVR